MPGKEEWLLVQLGSQHKCIERPVRPEFPDYLFLMTMVRLMRYLRKRENNSQWLATKSACDVAKGTPEARLDARLFKNELDTFLLYINENMITKIAERTNNQMCQPYFDSWVVVVLAFILDIAAVNARTILKDNNENYIDSRQDFQKNLATYLTILYIKNRPKVTNLKSVTISAIKEALKSSNVSVLRDDPDNQDLPIEDNGDLPDEGRGMKCHFRIKIFKA